MKHLQVTKIGSGNGVRQQAITWNSAHPRSMTLYGVTRPQWDKRVDYKIPLHLDVVDRYLRRMVDKTIRDEAPPSLESFYPPWVAGIDLPQSMCCGSFVSFTNKHK